MKCERCGTEFERSRTGRRFCSRHCQLLAKLARSRLGKPKPARSQKPVKRRRLFCHACGGSHRGDQCPSRSPAVRHFGTVRNGEYVPYPGSGTRVLALPNTVDGEQLTRILKEMKP
jgi:hypothetical protein